MMKEKRSGVERGKVSGKIPEKETIGEKRKDVTREKIREDREQEETKKKEKEKEKKKKFLFFFFESLFFSFFVWQRLTGTTCLF